MSKKKNKETKQEATPALRPLDVVCEGICDDLRFDSWALIDDHNGLKRVDFYGSAWQDYDSLEVVCGRLGTRNVTFGAPPGHKFTVIVRGWKLVEKTKRINN